jgi:hypothetical protein
MRHMRVVEEEVSLSQPETIEVPPEEEEVPVLQGPAVTIPLGEEVPPEEEEVIAPPPRSWSRHRAPLSWSHRRKKSRRAPLSWFDQKEGDALS